MPSYSFKIRTFKLTNRRQEQQKQGVGEHSDSELLTSILQDDDESNSGGLQVLHDGEWMDVATGGLDVLG